MNVWENRIGSIFRELTLISYEGSGMCKFICSCGKETVKRYIDVKKGKTTSCGHNKEKQKMEDLTGVAFNFLTAIKNMGYENGQVYYLFQCTCGEQIVRMAKEVKRGKIGSCGCKMGENAGAKTTHGLSNDRLYRIYKGMIRRCYCITDDAYIHYGGRGVSICDDWLDEDSGIHIFYEWALSNGYHKDFSIDRIDVNGNYEPSNCRWADIETQANNKRNSIYYEYNGETLTLPQWARKLNLEHTTLWGRINTQGKTFEEAISIG